MKCISILLLSTLLATVAADNQNRTDIDDHQNDVHNSTTTLGKPSGTHLSQNVLYNQGSLWNPDRVARIKAKVKAAGLNNNREDSAERETSTVGSKASVESELSSSDQKTAAVVSGSAYRSGYAGTPDSQPIVSGNYRGAITTGGNRRRNSFGSYPNKAYIIGTENSGSGGLGKEAGFNQELPNLNDAYSGYEGYNSNTNGNNEYTVYVPQGYGALPSASMPNGYGISINPSSGGYGSASGLDYNTNNNNNYNQFSGNNDNYNNYEYGSQPVYGTDQNSFLINQNGYGTNQNSYGAGNNYNANQNTFSQIGQAQFPATTNTFTSNQNEYGNYEITPNNYGQTQSSGMFSNKYGNVDYFSNYESNLNSNGGAQQNTDVYTVQIPNKFNSFPQPSSNLYNGNQQEPAYTIQISSNNNGGIYNVPSGTGDLLVSGSNGYANTYETANYNTQTSNSQNYNSYGGLSGAPSGYTETFDYNRLPPTTYGSSGSSSGTFSFGNNNDNNGYSTYIEPSAQNYYGTGNNNNNFNNGNREFNNIQGSFTPINTYEGGNLPSGTNGNSGGYSSGNSQFIITYGNNNNGYDNAYSAQQGTQQQAFQINTGSSNSYGTNLGSDNWNVGSFQLANPTNPMGTISVGGNGKYVFQSQSSDNIGGFSQYNDHIGRYYSSPSASSKDSVTSSGLNSGEYKSKKV